MKKKIFKASAILIAVFMTILLGRQDAKAWDFDPTLHIYSVSVNKVTKKLVFTMVVDTDGGDELRRMQIKLNGNLYWGMFNKNSYNAEYLASDEFIPEIWGESWGQQHGTSSFTHTSSGTGFENTFTFTVPINSADLYEPTYTLEFIGINFEDAGTDYYSDNYTISNITGWEAIAITGVNASDDDCDKVVVSWSLDAGYVDDVYYEIKEGSTVIQPASQTGSPYTDLTGTSTTYTVKAGYSVALVNSATGQDQGAVTGGGGGVPPSNVMATSDLCKEIRVTWEWFGNNPLMFDIRKSTNGGAFLMEDNAIPGDKREFIYSTTSTDTYEWKVDAKEICGWTGYSAISAISRAVLNPPEANMVSATPVGNDLRVTWGNTAAYGVVLKRISDGAEMELEYSDLTTSGSNVYYTDDAVSQCETYSYKVKVQNVCGSKTSSTSASGKISPSLIGTFSSSKKLVCSKGYFPDKVVLNWDYNYTSTVEQFLIYRREYYGGSKVLIATIDPTSTFMDETAVAGEYYEYSIVAEMNCENDIIKSNESNIYCKDIGFRIPQGIVSGAVTFEGGAGVPGVSIIAETEDNFGGNGMSMSNSNSNIEVSHVPTDFAFTSGFSFQSWVKPTSTATKTLFQKGAQYKVEHSTGNIKFTAGSQSISLNFPQKVDTFFCVNAVREANALAIYVVYDELTVYKATMPFSGTTSSTSSSIYIGDYGTSAFSGYIEDIRIWSKGLSEEEVINTSVRYISGGEANLEVYLRLNEMFNNVVYDISRSGANYHENHGYVTNCLISPNIPFARQLSVKGITDDSGNYLITGIPYTVGSVYTFVPVFEVHEFDPHQRQLFVGPGASTHNNIDFVDIAAFKVTGNIKYKDTYFPVKDVNFMVDGKMVLQANGIPETSDQYGNYEIYIPIGWHNLQVIKNGHGFEGDGFYPLAGNHNFQAPIPGLNFIDTTLIKVIGKVTGGPNEAAKMKGLGRTVNNIGFGEITLTTQKEFDLATGDTTNIWVNEYYEGYTDQVVSTVKNTGSTQFDISGLSPKSIKISPDHTTGEFTAYLLPEKYIITGITAGSYTYPPSHHTTVDLTNVFGTKTEIDSIVENFTFVGPDTTFFNRIDSVQYNHNLDLIYREVPSVSVLNKNDDPNFWESEIIAQDGTLVQVTNPDGSPKTLYPIFKQRGKYDLKISVFEQYINANNSNAIDNVPVTDGTVEIQNGLAIKKARFVYNINSNGQVFYRFLGGLPNITTGGIGDYLQTMVIVAKTGQGGSISTPWEPNGNTFIGYVLGGMPTGNNFVTTGPTKVDMILRDPPGSNSYSYIEIGESSSKTSTLSVSETEAGSFSTTVSLGTAIRAIALTGPVGFIVEAENKFDATVGLEHSTTWLNDSSFSETVTSTQRWQTSDGEDFVGRGGDVFIGHSNNIVYGKSTFIDLIGTSFGEGHTGPEVNGYRIGKHQGIRVNPEFATAFQYSQNHIEIYLIPNLKMLRNYILEYDDAYTSVHPPGHDLYGENNSTGMGSNTGYTGGDSYNITVPSEHVTGELFTDSVEFYNQQISGWEKMLSQNEEEKVKATEDVNISFDAGVIYENSTTTDTTITTVDTYEWNISPSLGTELGHDFNNFGVSVTLKESYTYQKTEVDETTTTTTTTFGYLLNDGNAGDYLSIDIKKAPTPYSPVFLTRGGQTMCPYEEGEYTKYYQPGTPLSEATMQREVPKINCENPIQTNVPADAVAIFNVQLSNISESEDAQWMVLSIDETSNQDGASIKMDGTPINDGRLILLPAGETINKIVTVEMVQPDVYDYNDLVLILHSACQFDPTDFQGDIADSIQVSAYFQPVCSGVDLNNPDNQWVINTNSDTTINIGISNYDLAHNSFDKILMRYKSTSTPNWATDMIFYVNEDDFNNASEPKAWINNQASMNHVFQMEDMQDRNYDIKLTTTCVDGTENNSETATGIKDVKRPMLFGSPQPADGILTPNDEVMLTFDEGIFAGGLLPYNFSVRGVLNGNELKHESCVFFNGVSDYASVVRGVNLSDKSFTVEFWARRGDLTPGVVFSQDELEMGFNAANKFYLKANNQTIISQSDFTDTDTWYHFAATYDYDAKVFNMYINDVIEQSDIVSTSDFLANGRMYVGKSNQDTDFFNGFVHELRVWEATQGFGIVYANMYQSLIGNEIGLGGYWPMSEAQGTKAEDKSRNHHANLYGASWRVFPTGFARTFDGTSSHVDINTGSSVVVTYQMDFTVELYFKGQNQGNAVLFSNGTGDGTDITPRFENIWLIGIDGYGQIYVKNNGVIITIPEEDFLDNEWHHLSLVCNRQANTSLFIDGEMKAYDLSSKFSGFNGPEMAIGARLKYSDIGSSYDHHFNGSIDELRIWNLSRSAKQLELDMNSKLRGDEMGLLAYYPFDKYDPLGIMLESSMEDITGTAAQDATASESSDTTNIDVPNIKDARPVQTVNFDWVVNNDKIIININEQPSAVEKCILEFTVDRVEDLRENRMASPVTWTAYIKQNSVIWNETQMNFTKQVYDELEFDVNILNIGGTEESYTISGLPEWLTVNEATGTLFPDSYKTLHFTVNPVVNIGDYDVSIFLTSDFGYAEKLALNLNVFKTAPDWEANEDDYQYSMNIIGQLKIDGRLSVNENDKIAAFVMEGENEVCRGVANSTYVEEYDMFENFLTVYSNQESGEYIYFKIWNASEGYQHVNVTPNLSFMYNDVIGFPSNPQIFETYNSYNFETQLNQGWTWMSFNLENEHFSNVNTIMADVDASTGDQIKTQTSFANYHDQYLWDGSLTDAGFNNMSMYMFKMNNAATLKYWGSKLRTDEIEIPVTTGWNWISYIPRVNMTVDDAFGNYQPMGNDILKSQFAFAMYDVNLGWIGDLQYLVPGQGYMYKTTNTSGTFTYPENGLSRNAPQTGLGHNPVAVSEWDFSPEKYEFSTAVVAELMIANVTENHIIGAFSGDECVGLSQAKTVGENSAKRYFITIHANMPGQITFKLINTQTGAISEINEEISFAANQITGDFETPYPLTLKTTGIYEVSEASEYFISHYPNPFTSEVTINYGIPETSEVTVEIFDILGKKVTTVVNKMATTGIYAAKWNGTDSSGNLVPQGVYMIKISAGDFVRINNIVKQ